MNDRERLKQRQAMSWNLGLSRLARLARKELRETLRDRRTVITLVLMPILVYPLLSISFYKLFLTNSQPLTERVITVGVVSESDGDRLDQYISRGNTLLAATGPVGSGAETGQELPPGGAAKVQVMWFPDSSLESHVANLDVQVAVRLLPNERPVRRTGRIAPLKCQIIYRENSKFSLEAVQFIEDRLRAVNEAVLQARMAQVGRMLVPPARFERKPLAISAPTSFSIATLVPLVLILMTITGAVYPAIDLTAGERERGTLESLIAAPISRTSLLLAKYIAVLTVAILTAMVNLAAMTATVMASGLGTYLFPSGVSLSLIAQIFSLMILFAAFFSAILLALTSFARSFKEAQAYLIPVMLLAISPGLMSLMPGLELNVILSLAPLVNIVLLSRDILEGGVRTGLAVIVVGSTAGYAVGAVSVAARIFGNDALLYASRGSWSDLFRRPARSLERPTSTATIACLAVMFPVYFMLANLARLQVTDLGRQLALNALVMVAVFGICPILFCLAQRVPFGRAFQWSRPPWPAWVGALLLAVSVWPFAHQAFLIGSWCGLASLDANQVSTAQKLVDSLSQLSPLLVIGSLAIVPAVLEEFFFRGYLLNGLCGRLSRRRALVSSALLFGLFHVLTPSVLTPERFLPSTLLGLVLGWVCLRTGSVFPGMVLHAGHNGLLLMMGRYQDVIRRYGWDVENQEQLPLSWLVAAAFIVLVGAAVIIFATRRPAGVADQRPMETSDGSG